MKSAHAGSTVLSGHPTQRAQALLEHTRAYIYIYAHIYGGVYGDNGIENGNHFLGCRVYAFRVWGLSFRVVGLGLRADRLGFKA